MKRELIRFEKQISWVFGKLLSSYLFLEVKSTGSTWSFSDVVRFLTVFGSLLLIETCSSQNHLTRLGIGLFGVIHGWISTDGVLKSLTYLTCLGSWWDTPDSFGQIRPTYTIEMNSFIRLLRERLIGHGWAWKWTWLVLILFQRLLLTVRTLTQGLWIMVLKSFSKSCDQDYVLRQVFVWKN